MPELADNLPYQAMLAAACERLKGKDVAAAAARAGMDYDAARGTIDFVSFGGKGRLFLPDWHVEGDFTVWQHIAVLQYLEEENTPAPVGEWVAIRTLEKGDVSRGESFDRKISGFAANRLGKYPEERIREACLRLGGELTKYRNADLSAVFRFLPHYPYLFNFWLADEEFPASGKVLIDAAAGRSLCLEAAGTMAELLVDKLCADCEAGGA